MSEDGLQRIHAKDSTCWGCGPSNKEGLQLNSIVKGKEVVAEWQPQPYHQAFPGILNGGIIGTLLDCHCNWTAAWHLMDRRWSDHPPCTVTAEYTIKLLKPTPTDRPVQLRAWVVDATNRRASIAGELSVDGEVTATCEGVFVAVKPGHPAYHRW